MRLLMHVGGDFGAAGMPGTFKRFFVDVVVQMARSVQVLTLPMPVHVDDCGLIGPEQGAVDREMLAKGCGCWVEQNRRTRPTSPQTVPRLATMTGTHPAPSAVSPSLSGVKSPTRSSVTVSSNLRHARRTSTALSVACSSLRQKPGEQLLCCSHTLHS